MGKLSLMVGSFLILFIFEKKNPQVEKKIINKTHDLSNLGLGALNLAIGRLGASFLIYSIANHVVASNIGILNIFFHELKIKVFLGVIILDCINYWWHRLAHKNPFLMKFHLIHHTDKLLNVSSAVRFHFLEVFLGYLFKLPFIFFLWLRLEAILIYDAIFNINVYFHHSNIKMNWKIDFFLSKLIVTPFLHRIHHSLKWKESNSNFSSFLILWDKVFKTYTPQEKISRSKYGVPGFSQEKYQNFSYMLKQPFYKRK